MVYEDATVDDWSIDWYRTCGTEIDSEWEDFSDVTYGYFLSCSDTGIDMCDEEITEFYAKDGVTYYRRDVSLSNITNSVYVFAISGDNAVDIKIDLDDSFDSDGVTSDDIQSYLDKFTPFVSELLATE